MTSVKEFRVTETPTDDTLGTGTFVFTDAYSVFDWGQMPDTIPQKGQALCVMGAYHFEALEEAGIPTHYRGVARTPTAEPRPLAALTEPPRVMAIDLTRTPTLSYSGDGYDYEAYHEAVGDHYLVPLEVVFRNTVPLGSSLRKRTTPQDHDLPFDQWPDRSVTLTTPIIEFSTKFERSDRYVDRTEAAQIAGEASLAAIEHVARAVNEEITRLAEKQGFTHQDGKLEVLYDHGTINVADVVGTFDENRFAYDGQQLSKEVLRAYYRETQPEWVTALTEAKQQAATMGTADWKSYCDRTPDPLPAAIRQLASELYTSGTNAYLGQELFDAPPIDAVSAQLQEQLAGG